MTVTDILTQEEIDALLHGVDEGHIDLNDARESGEAVPYDFSLQDKIVRGRMPTLELINERFARQFRSSLFNFLHKSSEVSAGSVKIMKFTDYIHSLFVPTSINKVKMRPLQGNGLFTLDAKLVFLLVDNFFGGDGRFVTRIEGREFTLTEKRIISLFIQAAFSDMKQAWQPVMTMDFEYVDSEINPAMANIVSPTDLIVVSQFQVDLEGGGGDFHVVMPINSLEPIRDKLDSGLQTDVDDSDNRWERELRDAILHVDLELSSILLESQMTLKDMVNLGVGDVITVDKPDFVTVSASTIPMYSAQVGTHKGNMALKIVDRLKQD